MYTYLGCGICYGLFVVTLMLKLKINNSKRTASFESEHSGSNASYNYDHIKYWVLLSMWVFIAIMMLGYFVQLGIGWDCRVNQLNRMIIVSLYIFVGLMQIVSTIIFLRECKQTFGTIFEAARKEIRNILIAFIFSYVYTSIFYVLIIVKEQRTIN